MTIEPTSKPLRQAGIYVIVVATSVALTLGSLKAFPQLLSPSVAENSTAIEVVPSQVPAVPQNQSRNFVADAVERVAGEPIFILQELSIQILLDQLPVFSHFRIDKKFLKRKLDKY